MFDDQQLRDACADLLVAASKELDAVALALRAVERDAGVITIEISISARDYESATVVSFDDRVARDTTLFAFSPEAQEGA